MEGVETSTAVRVGRDANNEADTCPFLFTTAKSADTVAGMYWKLAFWDTTAGKHTFSIAEIKEDVRQIDPKCLPALTSPNGTKYQLAVADDGTLSAVAVSE